MHAPATLCSLAADIPGCAADTQAAVNIIASLCQRDPQLRTWINFPLLNATGNPEDVHLDVKTTVPIATSYARLFPSTLELIAQIRACGVAVTQVRVAVLLPRDVLRPHIDQYPSTRYIVALNEQGTDFRHVFESTCFCMKRGQVWRVRGDICHGAANVAETGMRIAVIIDASGGDLATAGSSPIPEDQILNLPQFTSTDRARYDDMSWRLASNNANEEAERAWHFLPFEYSVPAAQVYSELFAFAKRNTRRAVSETQRQFWIARSNDILAPSLPFEVAPPSGYLEHEA